MEPRRGVPMSGIEAGWDVAGWDVAGWDVAVPSGWVVVEPPPGVALVALAPDDGADAFRANLLVTHQPRPGVGEPAVDEINHHVEMLLDALEANLPDAAVLGVWTAGRSPEVPERLATQRVLVAYTAPGGVEVEMLQQHVWTDDSIVTLTATVPADADQVAIDTLNLCLESLTVAG